MNNIKNIIILFFLFFYFTNAFSQLVYDKSATDPFININYDKVIIYRLLNESESNKYDKDFSIVKNKKLNKKFIKQSIKLNKTEIAHLFDVISDTNTYGGSTPACFTPSIGMVLFLKNKVIGWIDIGMDCNSLRSSFYISPKNYHNQLIGDVLPHDGLNECVGDILLNDGFSKQGRQKFNAFFTSIGLIDYPKYPFPEE